MDTTSINIIIGGVIGVSGALLGAVINGFANYKNAQIQARREQSKFQLSKLEELYELIIGQSQAVYWFRAKVQEYSINKPTIEQLNEMVESLTKQINKTITMTSFYAPNLFDDVMEMAEMIMDLQTFGLQVISEQSKQFEELKVKHSQISDKGNIVVIGIQNLSKEFTGIIKTK